MLPGLGLLSKLEGSEGHNASSSFKLTRQAVYSCFLLVEIEVGNKHPRPSSYPVPVSVLGLKGTMLYKFSFCPLITHSTFHPRYMHCTPSESGRVSSPPSSFCLLKFCLFLFSFSSGSKSSFIAFSSIFSGNKLT